MAIALIVAMVAFVFWLQWVDHKNSPACKWCRSRHRGRCIFNPRAGRLFANTDDGHFDVNDPNK